MVMDGNVRVDSLAGRITPQENRGHYGPGHGLQRQIPGSEAKGLRSPSVGIAGHMDMELILMVAAPKGDRKTQLDGKGLSA